MGNGTTTRSPTWSFEASTPRPTSTTSPMNSWPMMSPSCMVGDVAVQQVQVGAADGRRRDPHDGVTVVQDGRVRDVLDLDLVRADPAVGLHACSSFSSTSDRGCAGCCGNSWRARLPHGAPSDRTTCPVSMTCLIRRRASSRCWDGSSPKYLASAFPRPPPGASYVKVTCTSVLVPSGACTKLTSPELATSAPSVERQDRRLAGTSSVVSASHSTSRSNGALTFQWLVRGPVIWTSSTCAMNDGNRSKLDQKPYTSSGGLVTVVVPFSSMPWPPLAASAGRLCPLP